jgi:hypothetical protein
MSGKGPVSKATRNLIETLRFHYRGTESPQILIPTCQQRYNYLNESNGRDDKVDRDKDDSSGASI